MTFRDFVHQHPTAFGLAVLLGLFAGALAMSYISNRSPR